MVDLGLNPGCLALNHFSLLAPGNTTQNTSGQKGTSLFPPLVRAPAEQCSLIALPSCGPRMLFQLPPTYHIQASRQEKTGRKRVGERSTAARPWIDPASGSTCYLLVSPFVMAAATDAHCLRPLNPLEVAKWCYSNRSIAFLFIC